MPLFALRGCIEPDARDPTGLPLSAGHTDTTAALRWFVGQTGRLFADPAAGLRSGGIKPPPKSASAPRIGTAQQPLLAGHCRRRIGAARRAATAAILCFKLAARTRLPRLILIRGNACGLPGAHSTRVMHQVAGGFSIGTAQQPRPIGAKARGWI